MKLDALKTILAQDTSQSHFNNVKVHPTTLPAIRKSATITVNFTSSPKLAGNCEPFQKN